MENSILNFVCFSLQRWITRWESCKQEWKQSQIIWKRFSWLHLKKRIWLLAVNQVNLSYGHGNNTKRRNITETSVRYYLVQLLHKVQQNTLSLTQFPSSTEVACCDNYSWRKAQSLGSRNGLCFFCFEHEQRMCECCVTMCLGFQPRFHIST